jgi:hypothetical protein
MLLIQTSLFGRYWAEGLHNATYLLNRFPSKMIQAACLHLALFGSAPSYEHLHVFGYACYPNTDATAPHKLTPWSTRCVFLGYFSDHKGYHCLGLSTNGLIVSRHVVSDEDSFPLAASPNLTDRDFLLESGFTVSTNGTQLPTAGSTTTAACQPALVIPSGFEPLVAPLPGSPSKICAPCGLNDACCTSRGSDVPNRTTRDHTNICCATCGCCTSCDHGWSTTS